VAERASAHEDKRQLILDAALRVFAQKGYHTARVGDIAQEAGVAYGLLYHYFRSKDEVLDTIFRDTWEAMLGTIKSIEETGEPAREQLRKVSEVVLRTWRRNPDLVRVLVREVTRSPHVQRERDEIEQAFDALERIIRRGQEAGEFRDDLDPRLGAWIVYGALEELLTGWAFGQLPDSDDDVTRAEQAVVRIVCQGLVSDSRT
jgi:TetR/AcrR family fatty acid metabolism transcriptional regulator